MPAGSSAPSGHSGSAFAGMPALGSLPTHSVDVTKSASGEPSLFTGQVQLLGLHYLQTYVVHAAVTLDILSELRLHLPLNHATRWLIVHSLVFTTLCHDFAM